MMESTEQMPHLTQTVIHLLAWRLVDWGALWATG